LIRRIAPEVRAISVEDYASLEDLRKEWEML